MADIVDLSSLIRRDETVDGTKAFGAAESAPGEADDLPQEPGMAQAAASEADGADVTVSPSADGLLDFGTARPTGSGRAPQFDPMLDWSNQELADLTRVQRLLSQAGVNVSTDRGVTDEGDPWFVFLDAYGEVFVHLCRIEGRYVLDSAVQDGVVSGPCFATLIERFAGRASDVAAIRPDGTNVINLKRRGKIVMHPGAALAALIWSILLATEDLTFLEEPIPSSADGGADGAAAQTAEADGDIEAETFQELFLDQAEAAEFLAAIKAARDGGDRGLQSDLRDGGTHSAAGPGSPLGVTGLGLTALAAAYGINLQQSSEEPDATAHVSETIGSEGKTETAARVTDDQPDAAEDPVGQAAAAGQLFAAQGGDAADNAEGTPAQAKATPELSADALAAAQGAAQDTLSTAALVTKAELSVAETQADGGPGTGVSDGTETADAADGRTEDTGEQDTTKLARFLESVGLEGLLDGEDQIVTSLVDRAEDASETLFRLIDQSLTIVSVANAAEREFGVIGARLVLPTIESPDAVPPGDGLGDPLGSSGQDPVVAAVSPYEFDEFSPEVREFIDHLFETTEIEVIALQKQILLVDARAMDGDAEDAFYRTWSLDEERTISTIGIKADFEAFDLVA